MSDTQTLYRPVGPEELELIRESGWQRFPPRLPHQPIFYPVLQKEYAIKIARDWNVPESGAGFVTSFKVSKEYLNRYEVHEAGGREHTEYWIPAEELPLFNDHIVGAIEVVAEFGAVKTGDEHAEETSWSTAYDLEGDQESIELLQDRALNSKFFGIVSDVALVGSKEWWQAIRDGRIPKHVVRGTISRIYMSGHGDWPEFEIESEGRRSQWTRFGRDDLYCLGSEVKLDYVLQETKRALGQGQTPLVLRILIRP